MFSKENIKLFFKKYYLPTIFFVVVGLLSVSQQFLAIKALGNSYRGVPLFNGANADVYIAKMRELREGHYWVSSPYFFEYKNLQPLVLPTGEFVYTIVGLILGLSATSILILNQFLFPAILFLLVYFLVIKLTQGQNLLVGRLNAAAAGLLVVFGFDFIDVKFAIQVIIGRLTSMHSILWNRPINPVAGEVTMFLLLIIIWHLIESKRRVLIIPAGLILALTVGYYFSFGVSLSVLGSLFIIYLLKKNYSTAINLLLTGLTAFVVLAPYWYLVAKKLLGSSTKSGGGQIGLFGGYFTHQPVLNKVLLASFAVYLLCFIIEYFKQKKLAGRLANWWWFCLAFFIGSAAALNAQVIIGVDIWHYHFVQFTIPLVLTALMVLGYNFLLARFYKIWGALLGVVFITTLLFGVQTALSYKYELNNLTEAQKYNQMFTWIDANTPKDCVIFTVEQSDVIARLIPALTHCNTYQAPGGYDLEAPRDRKYSNFLSNLRINEVKPLEVENYLKNNYSLISLHFFKDWDQLFSASYRPWMDESVKRIVADYSEFVKKDFFTELNQYKLDYLLAPKELSKSILRFLPSVKFLHQASGLYLYQF